jgi:hypothetical protein
MPRQHRKQRRVPQTQPTTPKQSHRDPQAQQQPQMQQGSTFGEAVKSGIGMGVGIEAVRGAIGMLSGNNRQQDNINNQDVFEKCKLHHDEFSKCLQKNPEMCYDYYQKLSDCMLSHQNNNINN